MGNVINNSGLPELKIWTRDQCYELHLRSLEILERTGIIVHDETAREIYKKGGARVKGKRVHLPAWMIKEAINTAPDRITLYGRGGNLVELRDRIINYGLGTDLPNFRDTFTGEYRQTTYQDIVDVARVTDYLANLDFVASLGLASDVTTRLADLYHFQAMLLHCSKPIFTTATDRENLQALIDMAAVVAGGYDELKEKPSFLLYTEPISPLVNSVEAHQKLILAAEHEIPVTYAAGISAGATGPMTIAGNFALANAEGLGGLVLHQLVNPGAPFLYGVVPGPMDMKTTITLYGGPEVPLNYCLAGEMSDFYHLPSFGLSGCTDSAQLDEQAAIEGMFSIFAAAHSGTNLVHDNGYIGNGLVGSLDMLLFCDECINMVKYYMNGIPMGPGKLSTDPEQVMKEIADERWDFSYLDRKQENRGNNTLEQHIKEKIEYILNTHTPEPLTGKIVEELEQIIRKNEERLD